MSAHLVAGVLGGITIVGGAMGYLRKRSVASLVAGLLIGASYLYSAMLLNAVGDAEQGRVLAIATSAVLGAAMGVRYVKTLKPMPLCLTLVGIGAGTFFAVN